MYSNKFFSEKANDNGSNPQPLELPISEDDPELPDWQTEDVEGKDINEMKRLPDSYVPIIFILLVGYFR